MSLNVRYLKVHQVIVTSERKKIADKARQFYRGELSFKAFLMGVPEDSDDDEVAELIDMIEHEPQRGGFLGVSESEYAAHMARIESLIQSLSGGM